MRPGSTLDLNRALALREGDTKTKPIWGRLLALELVSCAAGATAPQITIRVVNSANVERQALTASEKQAGWVLARAGIEVVWQDCSVGPMDACATELRRGEFWLHVANWKPAGSSIELLGFTELDPSLTRGPNLAVVYYPMVKQMATSFCMGEAPILGAALAHEIGHLLGADHSATGVMRARFDWHNIDDMAKGGLLFTRDQGARLRSMASPAVGGLSSAGAYEVAGQTEHHSEGKPNTIPGRR